MMAYPTDTQTVFYFLLLKVSFPANKPQLRLRYVTVWFNGQIWNATPLSNWSALVSWRMWGCVCEAGSGRASGADLGRRRTCWVMTRPKLSSALVISLLSAGEVYDGVSQARLRRGSRSLNYLDVHSAWHHRALWNTLMRRVWSDLHLLAVVTNSWTRPHTSDSRRSARQGFRLQWIWWEIWQNINNYHTIE